MKITELQNAKIFQIQDDQCNETIIAILDEGEVAFYEEIEMKYSYFERTNRQEKEKGKSKNDK